jgi:lysophospholipase L1-like esterase
MVLADTGGVGMKRLAFVVAVVALGLVALDLATAAACRATGLADRVVDVQQPDTLRAKLDRLRAAPHPRVVLVGDSLVHGGTLEEAGDGDWRSHELGAQLQHELGPSAFVMNLGINGALPADLECLVPLVAACDVDWIIFDVHLRPFSADFSAPEKQMARPWLADLSADGGSRLSGVSALVRNRTLVQENLTASRPPVLRPPPAVSEADAEIQALVKLAQLKNRLKHLDLDPDAPQAAALRRLLADLAARGQRHVVFYATENPDLLPDVMDPDEHARWYGQLTGLVRGSMGPGGVFVPPLSELAGHHFTDFTHLNAEGYRLLARRLAAEIR